jgi:hypothetical protein
MMSGDMKLRLLLLLAVAGSLCAVAGDLNPADEKAVLAAEKQYADAMVKHDAAVLEKVLADDLSYTHSSMTMETKADILNGIRSGKIQYKSIDFKTTKVRQYGNTIITNHEMVFAQAERSNNVYVTMVWVKQGGGWQMVQRQATRMPQ